MKRCGATSPTVEGACVLSAEAPHNYHSSGTAAWADAESGPAPTKDPVRRRDVLKGRTPKPSAEQVRRLRDIGARATPETHVNPLRDGRPGTDAPAEAIAAWSKDEWVKATMEAFRTFLLTRTEPFTTPEHFWPLIEAPAEKRAMVIIIRRALQAHWITEVGAVRLRGRYTTKDEQVFTMNKLVPRYRSLIADPTSSANPLDSKDS